MHDLVEPLRELLQDGPRLGSELVQDLLDGGFFDDELLAGLDEGDSGRVELEFLVQDVAAEDDDIWVSAHLDPTLALTSDLLGDVVLTHRLTAEEIEKDEVKLVPNLVVLDWDLRDRLQLQEGGGRLVHAARPDLPGDDAGVFEGPPGWLSGFSPGDLVAFRRTGPTVDVAAVPAGEPAEDSAVVEVLREAAGRRLDPSQYQEAASVVLDALATDGLAFRGVCRPLGELWEAAGLERKGQSIGFRDGEWPGTDESTQIIQRMELSRKFGFDPCCDQAYGKVVDFLHAQMDKPDADLVGSDGAGDAGGTGGGADVFDVDDLARALSHGWVAAAVAVSELHFAGPAGSEERDAGPALVRLGTAIVERAAQHQAAGRFVLALEAEHRGDALAAEPHLRQALDDEPGYAPPARLLAELEIDHSNLGEAVSLMERSGAGASLQHRYVTTLRRQIEAPYRNVGRNQPCPCGSGRKYKFCCLEEPKVLPATLGAVVDLKLLLFAHSTRAKDRLNEVAASACDPDHPDGSEAVEEMTHHPLMPDLLAFEGGCAEEYLDQRGQLLPGEERQVLSAALKEPRRIWEVVDVRPGPAPALRLHDPETGRTAEVHVHPRAVGGSDPEPAGTALLWRVVRAGDHDYPFGPRIEVARDQREPLRKLLVANPSAHDLARWYRDQN